MASRTSKVAVIQHSARECGVYAYGLSTFQQLSHSDRYGFMLVHCDTADDLHQFVSEQHVDAIIYNHHPTTMSWLDDAVLGSIPMPQFVICGHDHYHRFANATHHFNAVTTDGVTDQSMPVGRPVIMYPGVEYSAPQGIIKIGSCGFGQHTKNFPMVVHLANTQFQQPVQVNLHMAYGAFVDRSGGLAHQIAEHCRNMAAPHVTVNVSHEFLVDRISLAYFLNQNDVNVFCYMDQEGRGLSSAVDLALSANKPMAVSNSRMFRHVNHKPELCIEHTSLPQIIANGMAPLAEFHQRWSTENFLADYHGILERYLV